jgi:hypothetical protein
LSLSSRCFTKLLSDEDCSKLISEYFPKIHCYLALHEMRHKGLPKELHIGLSLLEAHIRLSIPFLEELSSAFYCHIQDS